MKWGSEQKQLDRERARLTTVQMVEREGSSPQIDFATYGNEATSLDTLIRTLGVIRADLLPAASEMPRMTPVRVVSTPDMEIGCLETGEHILYLCHPAYGWVGFHIDETARTWLTAALRESDDSKAGRA